LKINFNSTQHAFTKNYYHFSNFFHCHYFHSCSQGQSDSIYFDPSGASDLILHSLLFEKLSSYGLCIGWMLCNFATNFVIFVFWSMFIVLNCAVRCSSRLCSGTFVDKHIDLCTNFFFSCSLFLIKIFSPYYLYCWLSSCASR
jgi:hypothetical protein